MATISSLHRFARLAVGGAVLSLAATAALASDAGQFAAQQVSQSNYIDLMDNWLYTHNGDDRGFGPEHDLARANIVTLFQSYGWDVQLHPFNYFGGTYYNVVATRTGVSFPNQEYIVGAHYDSVDNPGADDNASGTALILETARVLGQYESDYTIRLIAFDREEQGLYGSYAYASQHSGDDGLAVISGDMVNTDTGTGSALTYARSNDTWLINSINQALWDYGGLTQNYSGWNGQSDHASFDDFGVDSALLIESLVWSNPFYHQQNDSFDTPNYLNFDYATNMTRTIVGWLVDQAVVHVDVDTLDFEFPAGRPDWVSPQGGTTMRVEVLGVGDETPLPGTGVLHYDVGSGWQNTPMQVISDNVYDAVFPAAPCGVDVKYYVSAQGMSGDTYTDPYAAPDASFQALAVNDIITLWSDNFQTHTGWQVSGNASTGMWERAVPNGGGERGDPPADHDGSGMCYVTENGSGDTDIDGGYTYLDSPTIDLSGGDAIISAAIWYTNNFGADPNNDLFKIYVSNNNGSTWTLVETIGPVSAGGWNVHSFTVGDFVTPNNQIRVRYEASDLNDGSVVEAGVDAFAVLRYDCESDCPADLDGDGTVGQSDLGILLSSYGQDGGGDIDGDGDTDQADLGALLGVYGQDCP